MLVPSLTKIRNIQTYGYYKFKDRSRHKTRYKYIRKAYFFPKTFEKELTPFQEVDLAPRVEGKRIILEPRKNNHRKL